MQYTDLDTAIENAADGGTVTVLKDTTLSSAVTKSVTLKGAEGAAKPTVTVTAVPDAAAVLFGGASTTLENIVISGGDTPNNAPETTQKPVEPAEPGGEITYKEVITKETRYGKLINRGQSLTVKNAGIKNIGFAENSYGAFTLDNVQFSGIYRDGWFLTTTGDSTLKNVTAANNNFKYGWVGFICTEKGNVTFENCTIKDNNNCRAVWTGDAVGSLAVLNGGNDLAAVCIGRGGALKINEAAPMSKLEIDNKEQYSLTLGVGFSGELTIPLNADTAAAGKAVAKVEDGADVSGVTVTGMDTEALELKTADGGLVIAVKAAEFSAAASLDEIKKGTGEFSDTVAAGFKADVTNTGSASGTFNTVKWDVTSKDVTKTTGDQKITEVSLDSGAKAEIYLIVSGLDDKEATATVEVK